ncbi:MAG: hypothetical protein QOJ31_906 [Gaiellales bacterium]|jgi:hypothetical protein|nr:hypothetical protein [Gaiellales bacterium]MDX6550222.1 hypothetical protein [Gaiellales bacterium]
MTQNEAREGSVVDLVARIARERSLAKPVEPADQPEVVSSSIARRATTPTRMFPGAPRRRAR